jgi:hypothetical protein
MSERENTDANCGEVERVAETLRKYPYAERFNWKGQAEAVLAALTTPAPAVSTDEIVAMLEATRDDCRVFSEVRGALVSHERDRFAWRADKIDSLLSALSRTPAVTDEAVGWFAGTEDADGNELVRLPEAARDLLRAMQDDQRTVGYRLDLWNRLQDCLATLSHPVPGEQPQSPTAIVDGPRGPEFGEALAKDGPTQ